MKSNFLIVASSGQVRETLAGELRGRGYVVTLAASGSEARRVVQSVTVDCVLVESDLPDTSPDELRTDLAAIRPDCRVVLLASFERIRNSPALLRFGPEDFLLKAEQVIDLIRPSDSTADGEAIEDQRGVQALIQVIDVLVGLLEVDDRFFGGSSHRVMRLAQSTAEEMSSSSEMIHELRVATLLRDLGKVDLDPDLMQVSQTFTEQQKEQMKDHVSSSLRLFEHIDFPWKIAAIVRHHHERYDGTGFPDKLAGREIPMGARIVAVTDTFVALTSDRQHRKALTAEEALQELIGQAGLQFDPEVIEAFQRVLDNRVSSRRSNRKLRVLIYEPQKDFRTLLKMRLLNEGFNVIETTQTERALKKILRSPPDLVIADVDASTNETFQLLQELREDKSLCKLPFIFVSRNTSRVLKMRALAEGVDDFLSKEMDTEELVAHVENVIKRESIRREGGVKVRRGITGDLENLSLPDIVQTLVVGMKTACISLNTGKDTGKTWFENGTPRHAEAGKIQGEDAFYKMLQWTSGEFVIEHGVTCEEATINHDAMFLLMEGLRILDEEAHAAS